MTPGSKSKSKGSVARPQLVFGSIVVALFAAGILAFALSGGSNPRTSPDPQVAAPTGSVNEFGGTATSVEVGAAFPAFTLTEASGETLTRKSLQGKPSIVWFTTSYCVPCQVGATLVADLGDELGGDAFDVLVVFVDPGEPTEVLEAWRQEFANDDWMVAPDSGQKLTQAVELRFLDSKFLLDQDGAVRNVDFEQVDDAYLDLLRNEAAS